MLLRVQPGPSSRPASPEGWELGGRRSGASEGQRARTGALSGGARPHVGGLIRSGAAPGQFLKHQDQTLRPLGTLSRGRGRGGGGQGRQPMVQGLSLQAQLSSHTTVPVHLGPSSERPFAPSLSHDLELWAQRSCTSAVGPQQDLGDESREAQVTSSRPGPSSASATHSLICKAAGDKTHLSGLGSR